MAGFGGATCLTGSELPELYVKLGERNVEHGLSVPSGGDGANVPVVLAGRAGRRIEGQGAHYLYVQIAHPAYAKGPVDLYAQVDFFDDRVGKLSLQYDRAAVQPNLATKYTAAEQAVILTGSGKWRQGFFHLPQARLGHGQNHGADFRLSASGLAVAQIAVSPRRPAGFDPDAPVDAESLRGLAVARAPGMELTFGNDASPAEAALFKALTVTSVESYVDWAGVEPRPNEWDWSKWDRQVATLKNAKLKWVPFVIAGPAYATPLWYQSGPDSHYYRCLEHGQESKVQSLFHPRWPAAVERFIRAFAERYRDSGVIESVLLGITGIYGESIYPAGPEGGWTARLTGDYHNHAGWWAGDVHAASAFRAAMQKRYGDIAGLNRAWQTAHASFGVIQPFLPEKAPSDRARADLVEWYQQAMTDWSVFWVKTTRKHFPHTPIYLCTGGDGNPMLGADFTAQTAAIAKEEAGVRITNEASDYAHNWAITREVATATRLYRTFCGFEPAGKVDAGGVIARIYNATASGARQLHFYDPNVLGSPEALANFRAHAAWLVPRTPRLSAALYVPRESWALETASLRRFYELAPVLRDVADLDFLTRQTVADGHLRHYSTLLLTPCPVLEPRTAAALETWVQNGGTLVAVTDDRQTLAARLYDHRAWRQRLFVTSPLAPPALLKPALEGPIPQRVVIELGNKDDDQWLFGDWHGREAGPEWSDIPQAGKRWTGARPGLWLPAAPGNWKLRLDVIVPGAAIEKGPVEVFLNGQAVGRLAKGGRQRPDFAIPETLVKAEGLVQLEMRMATWKPSEKSAGSQDQRDLGVAIRAVEWLRAGAENQPATALRLRRALDRRALAGLTKTVGKGRTILLSDLARQPETVALVLAACLPDNPDGQLDGRFVTVTDQGRLWFDSKKLEISAGK